MAQHIRKTKVSKMELNFFTVIVCAIDFCHFLSVVSLVLKGWVIPEAKLPRQVSISSTIFCPQKITNTNCKCKKAVQITV